MERDTVGGRKIKRDRRRQRRKKEYGERYCRR